MSHPHFRLSLTNRRVRLCLGLVYLLQVTLLPMVHYAVHVGEHSEHVDQETQFESHDHHADHEHQEATVGTIIHGAPSCHHSSHDASTCLVCSNIFKATYSSYDIPSLTNVFPDIFISPAPDKPFLSAQFSPKSPRAPPSKPAYS